jgi:tyrosine decarboxylase/aspartate 1-decarboxylase
VNDLHKKGKSKDKVLQQLRLRFKKDLTYDSGKILGSMCTKPHPFAKQIYSKYMEKNLGDLGLFPASAKLENQAIQMLGTLLSNPQAYGNIVSGGTEANIIALWSARNLNNKSRNEVIVSNSAHYSFDRAADLLQLRLIKVPCNDRFQIDLTEVEKKISHKTLAIVGIAGTTDLGCVDPICDLSELALDHKLYLHVDAAFGGFVLPFLKELGYSVNDFDFRLKGVCSITMDPHKMGLAPIPAGGILFRNDSIIKSVRMRIPYLSGGSIEQNTLTGTRSGASAIAVWSLLTHLGRDGYKSLVKRCMKLTWYLVSEIEKIEGISLMTKPTMNIIGIKSDEIDIGVIASKLRRNGWAVSLFENHIRIAVMPHVRISYVQDFLQDLKTIINELKRTHP